MGSRAWRRVVVVAPVWGTSGHTTGAAVQAVCRSPADLGVWEGVQGFSGGTRGFQATIRRLMDPYT